MILDWLLRVGLDKKNFSLRSVAEELPVSLGLVQRVFSHLVFVGLLRTEGFGTAKRFALDSPERLFKSWIDHYNMVKKCKMWTYSSGFAKKEEMMSEFLSSDLCGKTALALHSAAEAYGCKNTTLQTLELYMLEPGIRNQLVRVLELQQQERGYDVLLIEPYYKSMLRQGVVTEKGVVVAPSLLTFLDLYHFPLRGPEQAEFMASRLPELKRIYKGR